jgi:hypothetical protein
MEILVLALSRLVPLLFLVSGTLVGSRYVHDVVLPRRPRAARWAAAAVALVGMVSVLPYTWRAILVVGARWATTNNRSQLSDVLHREYDAWNGSRNDSIIREWAFAKMSEGDWKGAEAVLQLSKDQTGQILLLTGLCQYNTHDPRAEQTLASIPDRGGTQLCVRDYLLGRLAEKRGDLPGAFALYRRSAQWELDFFPSTYDGARLLLLAGQTRRAAAVLDVFVRTYPSAAADPKVQLLRDCIAQGRVPIDQEFVIVSN